MKYVIIFCMLSLTIASCSKQDNAKFEKVKAIDPVPILQADFDPTTVTSGGQLYAKNCASCHGVNAEGSPSWRKRKPDGKLLPPPLNGSGHTWHHGKSLLISIITNGTEIQGGEMPAWENKLSPQEIEAVILWAQSKWPKETYESWLEINNR